MENDIFVLKWGLCWRAGRHTPNMIFQEYPLQEWRVLYKAD